jgi:putative drug exporter of the RND superfamily
MTLLGPANWWAPAPLRRLHQRLGLHETPAHPAVPAAPGPAAPGPADPEPADVPVPSEQDLAPVA